MTEGTKKEPFMAPVKIDDEGRKYYNFEDESGYKLDRDKVLAIMSKLMDRYISLADDSFEPIYGEMTLEDLIEDLTHFVQIENHIWADPL